MPPANLRKQLEEASKKIFDEVDSAMQDLENYPSPKASDSPQEIQNRILFLGGMDADLSYLYRQVLRVQQAVERHRSQARSNLEDKKMEEVHKTNLKLPNEYLSKTELELKLRARTIEEVYESNGWETLHSDLRYLADTIRSYQFQIKRERSDIETRLRYFFEL